MDGGRDCPAKAWTKQFKSAKGVLARFGGCARAEDFRWGRSKGAVLRQLYNKDVSTELIVAPQNEQVRWLFCEKRLFRN